MNPTLQLARETRRQTKLLYSSRRHSYACDAAQYDNDAQGREWGGRSVPGTLALTES